jgi:hypothetical protein
MFPLSFMQDIASVTRISKRLVDSKASEQTMHLLGSMQVCVGIGIPRFPGLWVPCLDFLCTTQLCERAAVEYLGTYVKGVFLSRFHCFRHVGLSPDNLESTTQEQWKASESLHHMGRGWSDNAGSTYRNNKTTNVTKQFRLCIETWSSDSNETSAVPMVVGDFCTYGHGWFLSSFTSIYTYARSHIWTKM